MIKTCLSICVFLVAASSNTYDQSRSKRVKQPRDVIEAYRVCGEFQRLLAEDLDFNRAFEATFTKDPARRREITMAESEFRHLDLSQADTVTLTEIYKHEAQLLILLLPMVFAGEERRAELFPPPVMAIFDRKPPNDLQELPAYAVQLKRDVAEFRVHLNKLAATDSSVAEYKRSYKEYLLKPLKPPNRVVKPMTGYSNGRVLRPHEHYYQIDNCAVVGEDGQMRLIGYIFFSIRW